MGKGDLRSKRGKVYRGTSGKTRQKKRHKLFKNEAPETKDQEKQEKEE